MMYDRIRSCMRRFSVCIAVSLAVLLSAAAEGQRITFERILAAPHDLGGAQDLAVIYAIGDTESVSTFLDVFIDQTNRSGTLRVHDATALGRNIRGTDRSALRRFQQRFGAQLFIRIDAFTCRIDKKTGEGSSYDFEGKRVRRRQRWVDAVCSARLDLLEIETLRVRSTFDTRGEGTSQRLVELTQEETDAAVDQAARYAAVAAAEEITPRKVRETIALDPTAPAFESGMSMIGAERLRDARRIWEESALRRKDSAPLQFNLAAVCEALGDVEAARQHYAEAQRLAPAESRYRIELEMFRRRNRLKE